MNSRPLTPPYVPFGIRRFNNLSAVPRIVRLCHHNHSMRGIRLLMTCLKSSSKQLANSLDGNWPILLLSTCRCQDVLGFRIWRMDSSIASRRFAGFFFAATRSIASSWNSWLLSNSTQASLSYTVSTYLECQKLN